MTPIRIRVLTALFALLLSLSAAMPAAAGSGTHSGDDGGFPTPTSGDDGGFPSLNSGDDGGFPSTNSVEDGGW